MRQVRVLMFAAFTTLVASVSAQAPAGDGLRPGERPYTRTEVMIPVRDGVKLHTVILRPEGSGKTGAALPFLMQRTPYGVANASARSLNSGKPELAQSGYIFVYQDIRGRYGSEGEFVMNRPIVAHNVEDRRRRDDGHARHDRLAAEERAATTAARWVCSASAIRVFWR